MLTLPPFSCPDFSFTGPLGYIFVLTSQTIQERSLDQGLWDQLISRAASSEPSSLARLCIPAGVNILNTPEGGNILN